VVLSRSRTLKAVDFAFLQTPSAIAEHPSTLQDMEKAYIEQILERNDWNVSKASGVLGIHRATLHKKIKRLGLTKQ
jgi:transcriptional regulator of acetoin/glycerol metabolism